MRFGRLLLVGFFFAVAVAIGTVVTAIEPTSAFLDDNTSPDGGSAIVDPADRTSDPGSDPIADLLAPDPTTVDVTNGAPVARSLDAYQADEQAEPRKVEEVPEPATVVSLAWLAAVAGGTLLVRLRWFRRG